MTEANHKTISRSKTIVVFILTILLGYALFIIPDVFFGITKINGGKIGINLLFIALFQFFSITALLHVSLKILGRDFSSIGLRFEHVKHNFFLGFAFGMLWTTLQFLLIIPNTGGVNRSDIHGVLGMYDGTLIGTLSFIALGVVGGGITEELFNRGYFITVLRDVFKKPQIGLWFSVVLSILVFSLGHMPVTSLDWFDILIPTTLYTALFVVTKQLTASIVAHGTYNMSAIILTYYIYYN